MSNQHELKQQILALEHENKSLSGKLANSSPDMLARLKTLNAELRQRLSQVEQELASALSRRKIPLDAAGVSDKLHVIKAQTLAFCAEHQIDPGLWKNLESL